MLEQIVFSDLFCFSVIVLDVIKQKKNPKVMTDFYFPVNIENNW